MDKFILQYDKILSAIIGAIFVPLFVFFYGAGDVVMYTMIALAFFVGMDWLAGVRAATKDKTYASRYGIDGIFRTFFILLLPAGGHFLDMMFHLPSVLFGLLAGGILYHTIKSMTANAIRAGWGDWVPENALNMILRWLESELESKASRSFKRKEERRGNDASEES